MAVAHNESRIPAGTILVGKYRVLREIGRGGMAAVYEAEHLSLRKNVAVKVLAAELTASKIVSERFFREARAAASVKSPHIVDVYDSGRLEDGRPFIVMEMLEGESLYDRMARDRLISLPDTLKIVTDCAKGLLKAHSASIVHRDLKPENIFIIRGEDGQEFCKLLDFGLAKFYAPLVGDEKQNRLTREGAVFGTPAYMSPEQVNGQGNVDHRADLWALGCMAYECLTGRPVWNMDQGVAMTFAAIATEPLPIPSHMNPQIPNSFDVWFKRALERDPDKRFQNAKELSDALHHAVYSANDTDAYPSLPEFPVGGEIDPTLPLSLDSAGRVVSDRRIPVPGSSASGRLDAVPASQSSTPRLGQEDSSMRALPSPLGSTRDFAVGDAPRGRERVSTMRYVAGGLLLSASAAVLAALYTRQLAPQLSIPVIEAPPAAPVASGAGASTRPAALASAPAWTKTLAEGQRLLANEDLAGAVKKFRDAERDGANNVGKAFLAHAKVAAEGHGSCRLKALSRPRFGITGNAGRPAVALSKKGAIMVWTDDHEQAGREHAYSVLVDENGVALEDALDVTPEATQVVRPVVLSVDEKLALFYWDRAGREAGVRGRLLDEEGGIAGDSMSIAAPRPGQFWASFAPIAGGYVAAWQDDRDGNDDLFLRRVGVNLDTQGPEVRVTDYAGPSGRAASVKTPALAITGTQILTAFRLDRGTQREIQRARLPIADLDQAGLPEVAQGNRADRVLGDVRTIVRADKAADSPSVACGRDGCFVAWYEEPAGVSVAFLEPKDSKRLWYKNVSAKGTRPSIATGREGDVVLSYFEAGKLKISQLSRVGAGPATVLAKATAADAPRPTLVAGRTSGEWYVAWLDNEFGHLEPYMVRLLCPR